MDVYQKLKELGLKLPEAPAKGGVYTPCKLTEDGYAYISGCGPCMAGETISGKLGKEFDVAQGQKLAESCMLNVLAVLEKKTFRPEEVVVVNLSGRGDKDMKTYIEMREKR